MRHETGCGSEIEPASSYRKVAGPIPLICMSKCPWARYWSHHHQCMNVCLNYCRTKAFDKCPKCNIKLLKEAIKLLQTNTKLLQSDTISHKTSQKRKKCQTMPLRHWQSSFTSCHCRKGGDLLVSVPIVSWSKPEGFKFDSYHIYTYQESAPPFPWICATVWLPPIQTFLCPCLK